MNYERDLKEHKNTKMNLTGVFELNSDLTTYGTWDHYKRSLELGGIYKVNNFIDKGALSLKFDLSEQKEGKVGEKSFAGVVEKKIDDNTNLRVRLDVGNEVALSTAVIAKVNDNLKLRLADTVNPLAAWNDKNLKTYQYGLSADFEF